jgi:rhodanese-related sulfurtransferase
MERQEPLLVVDTRDASAWLLFHIPGSMSVPAGYFSPDVLTVRNRNYPFPVLLVGSSDEESLAVFSLKSWGRSHKAPVYILEGGFDAWKAAGYPVENGGVPTTAADLLPPGEVGFDEFRSLWNRGAAPASTVVLNVKENDESTPAGQINIPLHELETRMQELPHDKELVIYCYTGTRARIAFNMLKNNGYRARFFNRTVRVGNNGELLE